MGTRRSRCTESDLAIGDDQGVGRSKCWVGLSGGGDRLLHTRDRGLGLVTPLPNRRSVGIEQAVLNRLPAGSREVNLMLTTDNGTQFTSTRFLQTLSRLGITHRRTAYHHPEGNSYIERFHRSLKEEEVWVHEYRSLEEARASIGSWIEEYNHNRPRQSLQNRAFLAWEGIRLSEVPNVQIWGVHYKYNYSIGGEHWP
jgi:transposase InsO family protein